MVNSEKEVETEHQVKQVKGSTILYSINHCQKWNCFQNSGKFFNLW